jgi:hypothetical protein
MTFANSLQILLNPIKLESNFNKVIFICHELIFCFLQGPPIEFEKESIEFDSSGP